MSLRRIAAFLEMDENTVGLTGEGTTNQCIIVGWIDIHLYTEYNTRIIKKNIVYKNKKNNNNKKKKYWLHMCISKYIIIRRFNI